MLLWYMLVLSARFSGSLESRTEQSSTTNENAAFLAIDYNIESGSFTQKGDPAWLQLYFKKLSFVEKVVVDRGYSNERSSVSTVLVYNGDAGTVCGI